MLALRDHFVTSRPTTEFGLRNALSHHSNLTRIRANEGGHHHGDDRILDELLQLLLNVASKLGRRFARRLEILDQGHGHSAIGADRYRLCELRISADEDGEVVERANHVVRGRNGRQRGRRRWPLTMARSG